MDEKTFLIRITDKELQTEYSAGIRRLTKQITTEFNATRPVLQEQLINGFDEENTHDRIINTCIYPFVETALPIAQLGYRFVRAAPLSELGFKNIDFLIYRSAGRRPIAIFGEAKGGVTNLARTLTEFAERRQIIERNLDYIKTNYLDTSSDPICEYVLAVKSSMATRMRDSVLESEIRLILWQVDYMHHKLQLVQAPSTEPDRHLMTHSDPELTSTLAVSDGLTSFENTFAFFPQSHILAKLLNALQVVEKDGPNNILRPYKLNQYITAQLSYLDEARRQEQVEQIIQEALTINFAAKIPDSPDYLIASKSRSRASLEDEVKLKWIKSKLDKTWSDKVEEARERLQSETLEKQRRNPGLDSFSV